MHDAVKDESNKNQIFIHGDSMVKHVKGWERAGSESIRKMYLLKFSE